MEKSDEKVNEGWGAVMYNTKVIPWSCDKQIPMTVRKSSHWFSNATVTKTGK